MLFQPTLSGFFRIPYSMSAHCTLLPNRFDRLNPKQIVGGIPKIQFG